MAPEKKDLFDPFSDRTARDVRNTLSSAFITELTGGGAADLAACVHTWLNTVSAPVYIDYIRERLDMYRAATGEIVSLGVNDPRHQAVLLWNRGLFFELHELLEAIWTKARGPEKTALKGWIQAAGAYVHAGRGKLAAARGLAERAAGYLARGRPALGFIANLEELVDALQGPLNNPPRLVLSRRDRLDGDPGLSG